MIVGGDKGWGWFGLVWSDCGCGWRKDWLQKTPPPPQHHHHHNNTTTTKTIQKHKTPTTNNKQTQQQLLFKEDSTVDDLIDVIEGNRRYVRCLYVYNKVDVCSLEEVDEIARRPNSIPVSCHLKLNMDGLLERIWEMMALVSRVFDRWVFVLMG